MTVAPPAALAKRGVDDLTRADLSGKAVLLRADLNVPKDGAGAITDDTRLREAIPTLRYLVDRQARVVLASHLGRPKKGFEASLSLAFLVPRLATLLGGNVQVHFVDDCIGPKVAQKVASLPPGQVLLLENTRFHKGECANDDNFAKQLAVPMDLYVNDAFGCAHRAHASTAGVAAHLAPCVAGLLLQKELAFLNNAVMAPQRPFAAIVGGSKVSSKIGVLEALLEKCDKLIIGGGMVFTFLAARGLPVGASLVEHDKVPLARRLVQRAAARGVQLLLPIDLIVADRFAPDAAARTVRADAIPDGWMGLDVGPQSLRAFAGALAGCRTLLWNGPMGVFEWERFAAGTLGVAHAIAGLTAQGATTVVGGGDSVAAVEAAGLAGAMSHVSTGGGAALELLEGCTLPGVAALDDARPAPDTAPGLAWVVVQYAYHLAASALYGAACRLLHRAGHDGHGDLSVKAGLGRSASQAHLAA